MKFEGWVEINGFRMQTSNQKSGMSHADMADYTSPLLTFDYALALQQAGVCMNIFSHQSSASGERESY